uniref:Uncharacterized protein n=1 Tax=Lepeophtheirus salmonis TaxID=72036 RepID=A0A0K2V5Z0_LEPSM
MNRYMKCFGEGGFVDSKNPLNSHHLSKRILKFGLTRVNFLSVCIFRQRRTSLEYTSIIN